MSTAFDQIDPRGTISDRAIATAREILTCAYQTGWDTMSEADIRLAAIAMATHLGNIEPAVLAGFPQERNSPSGNNWLPAGWRRMATDRLEAMLGELDETGTAYERVHLELEQRSIDDPRIAQATGNARGEQTS